MKETGQVQGEFVYIRASADRQAEDSADQAAIDGLWEDFVISPDPSGVNVAIAGEATESILARRMDDANGLSERLVNGGYPYGIIKMIIEERFPDLNEVA